MNKCYFRKTNTKMSCPKYCILSKLLWYIGNFEQIVFALLAFQCFSVCRRLSILGLLDFVTSSSSLWWTVEILWAWEPSRMQFVTLLFSFWHSSLIKCCFVPIFLEFWASQKAKMHQHSLFPPRFVLSIPLTKPTPIIAPPMCPGMPMPGLCSSSYLQHSEQLHRFSVCIMWPCRLKLKESETMLVGPSTSAQFAEANDRHGQP
jgi:hypothetical protein